VDEPRSERDRSFTPPADLGTAQVVAAYEAAAARSDEIVLAASGMDQLAAIATEATIQEYGRV
jgi:hypothetical protein